MNQKLTAEIINHVYCNLGILPSSFVNYEVTKSLLDKQYLLSSKLIFESENGEILTKPVYGCQITSSEGKQLKILVGDCSQDESLEYCLLIQMKDSPVYGAYLIPNISYEAMIAVTMDEKNWMPCNTYLQATFLAAMERLRDLGLGWSSCDSHKEQYQLLLSFLNFHSLVYGGNDEGQEI